MSGRYAIDGDTLTGIAGAIRTKLGVQTQYTPAQMATAIGTIHGSPVLQEKTATQNGIILPDSGYDGLSKVTVNVSGGSGTFPDLSDIDGFAINSFSTNNLAFYHEYNHDCTLYSVFSLLTTNSGYTKYIGASTYERSGESHGFYTGPWETIIRFQGFGNGLSKAIRDVLNKKYALAISLDKTNGKIKYYAHTTFVGEWSGSLSTISSTLHGGVWYNDNSGKQARNYYAAYADRIHSNELVLANLQKLITAYSTDIPEIIDL